MAGDAKRTSSTPRPLAYLDCTRLYDIGFVGFSWGLESFRIHGQTNRSNKRFDPSFQIPCAFQKDLEASIMVFNTKKNLVFIYINNATYLCMLTREMDRWLYKARKLPLNAGRKRLLVAKVLPYIQPVILEDFQVGLCSTYNDDDDESTKVSAQKQNS